jgi:hypothetical protein
VHTGPHCKCHGAKLFDFTMCKRTHHADCSFEEMCARAHVPLHEALGEPAPATWKFTCPSCGEVFDSTAGGQQKLDEELEKIAGCTEPTRKAEALKYADKHDGIMHGQYGVLPCHHVVVEPMHGCHNEFNVVVLQEAIHEHLLVQSTDPALKETIRQMTKEINELWGSMHLQKPLYFGRDDSGTAQPQPTANGPDMKVILRHPKLLPKTMEIMRRGWQLTEPERKKQKEQPSWRCLSLRGLGLPSDFRPSPRSG